MSGRSRFHPCRAYLDASKRLVFFQPNGLERALRDGFFALLIPDGLDVSPGIRFAQEFYREPDSDLPPADARYQNHRKNPDIYFDRDNFQTEHILADARQRELSFPAEVSHLCDEMHQVARDILCDILDNLGVAPRLWPKVTGATSEGGGVKWFAVSHYRTEREMPGAPAHQDTGFITVLYCDQPGLQAKLQDGWVDIEPIEGHFLINFGGSLELLTSGLACPAAAVLHRVDQCSSVSGRGDRYSFAAFLNPPANDMLYRIAPNGQEAEPVMPVETFLREFNERTWQDRYADFGIAEAHAAGEGVGAPDDSRKLGGQRL